MAMVTENQEQTENYIALAKPVKCNIRLEVEKEYDILKFDAWELWRYLG